MVAQAWRWRRRRLDAARAEELAAIIRQQQEEQ